MGHVSPSRRGWNKANPARLIQTLSPYSLTRADAKNKWNLALSAVELGIHIPHIVGINCFWAGCLDLFSDRWQADI